MSAVPLRVLFLFVVMPIWPTTHLHDAGKLCLIMHRVAFVEPSAKNGQDADFRTTLEQLLSK
eukprot:scaffold300284_cov18-Prasinocladus_malaysianus.AAC.1